MALNEHTPGTPAGPERDPLLDRAYRGAATDEPPARLDAAILTAARREAGACPRPLGAALRTWHVPVSVAALIVLSVSVVTLMKEEGGVSMESPPPEAVVPPATPPRRAAEMDKRGQPQQERTPGPGRAPAAPEAKAPAAGPALRDDAGGVRQDAPVALSKTAEPAAVPATTPELRRERAAASASGRLAAEEQQPVWRGY